MSAGEGSEVGGSEVEDRLIRAAATQLYAGSPAEFIATRTALVKQAKADGHKDEAKVIAGLRRPSVAAWVLNQLVHAEHPVIKELADLGARLRHATSTLDAAGLAGLRAPRDAALASLVKAASGMAAEQGQRLSAAVEAEVRDTGIAALADGAAEEALRSGTLTRALSYSGFGEVDLSEATATTSTGVVLTSLRGGRRPPTEEPDDNGPEETDSDGAELEDTELDETELDETELDEDGPDDEALDEDEFVSEADDADEPGDRGAGDVGGAGGEDADNEDGEDDGAQALAEAAAEQERERRLAQAQRAVEIAEKEIGRHRASVEAARNRSEATRQRVHKLHAQLDKARAEDESALEKLSEALAAAKRADQELASTRALLAELDALTER